MTSKTPFLAALAVCALLVVPAAASAKPKHPRKHEHPAVKVHVKPHVVIIRIRLDADDANLLCESDLRALGPRAFVVRWAMRHDLRTAFSRCTAQHRQFRSVNLLERERGTATTSSVTIPRSATNTTATLTVPASVSAQGSIASGRPFQSGTFTSTLTADWSQKRHNGFGGFCAPATGTTTLSGPTTTTTTTTTSTTTPTTGTVTLSQTGKLCENGKNGSKSGFFFIGDYTVTASTATAAGTTAATPGGHGRTALQLRPDGTVRAIQVGGLHA